MKDEAEIPFRIRYPDTAGKFSPLIRIGAVADHSLQVNMLVKHLSCDEIKVDLLDPDKDITVYFSKLHPDALLLNLDPLGEEYLTEVIEQLKKKDALPAAVFTLARDINDFPAACKLLGEVKLHLHLNTPVFAIEDSMFLYKLCISRLADRQTVTEKLRRMTDITLKAMRCKKSAGLRYMEEGILDLMLNRYYYFGSAHTMNERLSKKFNTSVSNIGITIKNVINAATEEMSEEEYERLFAPYLSEGTKVSQMEFMYTAAALTAKPAAGILRILEDDPFPHSSGTEFGVRKDYTLRINDK